jgi:hypothetical protein
MKQPPIGSIVVDRRGSAWQRCPIGWVIAGSDMSWSYTWKKLLTELYEDTDSAVSDVTPEWAPVLGDKRLPCIVYVPHEELIWEDEDE